MQGSLEAAAAVWNDPDETVEQASAHVNDGVPPAEYAKRGVEFAREILENFPYMHVPHAAIILEIGSGTGYIMQAMAERIRPARLIGLDVAEHMLARARKRLGDARPYEFLRYDGVTVPLPDRSLDFIYSVAALQHVPKPHVYNLFFEIKRLLKPGASAVMHLLSWADFEDHQRRWVLWRDEVTRQVRQMAGYHWHHFYSRDELETVLRIGTRFAHVDVREDARWVCVS